MNKRQFISYILSLFLISITSTSSAEDKKDPDNIFLCDGLWSTNPCDSPESVLPYKQFEGSEISNEERERNNRIQAILHSVRTKASEIRNNYNASYDISYIELFCEDPNTQIAECSNRASLELDKLISYEIKLREQEIEKRDKDPNRVENNTIHIHDQFIRGGFGIHPRMGPRRRINRDRTRREPGRQEHHVPSSSYTTPSTTTTSPSSNSSQRGHTLSIPPIRR